MSSFSVPSQAHGAVLASQTGCKFPGKRLLISRRPRLRLEIYELNKDLTQSGNLRTLKAVWVFGILNTDL